MAVGNAVNPAALSWLADPNATQSLPGVSKSVSVPKDEWSYATFSVPVAIFDENNYQNCYLTSIHIDNHYLLMNYK